MQMTAWGLLVADAQYGTVDTTRPLHYYALRLRLPRAPPPTLPLLSPPRPGSTAARRRPALLGTGRTTGALRRRLLVVDVAIGVMLLTTVCPTGGHADLAKENRADAAPIDQLEQLIQVTGRNLGVVVGSLGDRVAKGHHRQRFCPLAFSGYFFVNSRRHGRELRRQ